MLRVAVIGSGNVAQHLIKVFNKADGIVLVQAFARHPRALAEILLPEKITDCLNNLAEADIYIIAVTDSAIEDVSAQLPFTGRLVAHTSGTTPLESLDKKNRRAVFYPLQTFSKNKELNFNAVPICLETERKEDYSTLEKLAIAVSGSVYNINSLQRRSLHVAAVFVSNFVNHMYAVGNDICTENDVSFEILKPLIQETADKIKALSPQQAQTGPAVRNDTKTIEAHLAFLQDENYKAIYKLLTQSIQKTNGGKL